MLSTHTINDVKAVLMNPYGFYGFSTDDAFSANLALRANEVKLMYLYQALSETEYARIMAKDKLGLTAEEECIYLAELYFIASEYLGNISAKEETAKLSSESLSVEGYSRSVSYDTKSTGGKDAASLGLYLKAINFLKRAGYDLHTLTYIENDFPDIGVLHL